MCGSLRDEQAVPAGAAHLTGQRWWLCPNTPLCPHAAVLHDIYDDEDLVPRCCAEGCDCGRAEAEARVK